MIYIITSYIVFLVMWIAEIKERTLDIYDILILILAPIMLPLYLILGIVSIIGDWFND